MPPTAPCVPCGGKGLVPRAKRRLPNGDLDPTDTIEWPLITCEACGGCGEVRVNLSTVVEKPPAQA